MNNQLKLLIYIALVALIFYFVQDKYNLFDISFDDGTTFQSKEVPNDESVDEDVNSLEYVDIYNEDSKVIRVTVEVADSEVERRNGLSGRKYLGDYEGMLFIMDGEVGTPFWMKGMFIDLDIMFIDAKGFIVDIKEKVNACSADFCPNIYSSAPYLYALEVNAGFSEINKIKVGNSILINIESN